MPDSKSSQYSCLRSDTLRANKLALNHLTSRHEATVVHVSSRATGQRERVVCIGLGTNVPCDGVCVVAGHVAAGVVLGVEVGEEAGAVDLAGYAAL
jgi:hypothetical protein